MRLKERLSGNLLSREYLILAVITEHYLCATVGVTVPHFNCSSLLPITIYRYTTFHVGSYSSSNITSVSEECAYHGKKQVSVSFQSSQYIL